MKIIKYMFLPVILLQCGLISAQTNVQDSIRNISLDEIVVSVNRTEENKKTVAQQVQVMTSRQIENLQPKTAADLLAGSGNVFIQKSQSGGGSVVIRGFEANRTLLVVDGVRMNNLIYRGGHLQNVITVDSEILERAEILFGPSSTIYGSDALGGVVHFYTKKPQFASESQNLKLKVNTLSRYGSVDNEHTEHLDINVGGGKIASLTSVSWSKFGDLRGGENQNPFYDGNYGLRPFYVERQNGKDVLVNNPDRFLQVQSGYSQYDVLQKIMYRPNENLLHGFNFQYSNSTDIPRYDRLTDPSGDGLKYAEWYYGPQKRLLGAYDFNFSKPSGKFKKIHASVNYQNVEESRQTRKFKSNDLTHRIEKVNVLGANLDFQKKVNSNNFSFGLDAQYDWLKSTAYLENIESKISSPLDTRYPDGENHMLNAALYFSHNLKFNDELMLTDGLRLGYSNLYSKIENNSFFNLPVTEARQNNPVYSGNIGLINTPSDDLKLSVLVSTGFRAPNVDDLSKIFETAKGNVIVPNNDLKPEKTLNFELGITKIFDKKSSWENSIFYTRFFDAIITDRFKLNGMDSIVYDGVKSQVFANQNKEEAFIYGFSSNFKSFLTDNFLLNLSMNYTYGRIKTDESNMPLDHIPPLMFRTQFSYINKKFSSDFTVIYNGRKKISDYLLNGEDNEQYATPEGMPAWYCVNFHASYKLTKTITLQSGIDNILDTQYRTFASGINAGGRNIYCAVRIHL